MNRVKAENIREIRKVYDFVIEDLQLEPTKGEIRDLIDELESEDDFTIDIDGKEYRFIKDYAIWEIYKEGIKEITEDCYEIKAPSWLVIDWEETAENCYVDGYGHHFSSYDGSEEEARLLREDWYIFRTN